MWICSQVSYDLFDKIWQIESFLNHIQININYFDSMDYTTSIKWTKI